VSYPGSTLVGMSSSVCLCRESAAEWNERIRAFTRGRQAWSPEALREWQRLTRRYSEAQARERLEQAA
jgi:hypothetical protein